MECLISLIPQSIHLRWSRARQMALQLSRYEQSVCGEKYSFCMSATVRMSLLTGALGMPVREAVRSLSIIMIADCAIGLESDGWEPAKTIRSYLVRTKRP